MNGSTRTRLSLFLLHMATPGAGSLGRADAGELIVVENFFEELTAKVGN